MAMSVQWKSQVISGEFPLNFRGWDVENIAVEARTADGRNWRVIVGNRWWDGEQHCLEGCVKIEVSASDVKEVIDNLLPDLQTKVIRSLERETRHIWRVLEAQTGTEVDEEVTDQCHRCGQRSIDVRVNDRRYVKVLVVDGRTTATPLDLHNWLGDE